MSARYEGERPGDWSRLLLRLLAFLAVIGINGILVVGAGAFIYFASTLPEFNSIDDYQPALVTRIYDQSGQVIGELAKEKRILVSYEDLPPKLVAAFIASEDDRFFIHNGIDYIGILRAAIANIMARRVVQGGSTITQQVAKSLIISTEGYAAGTARNLVRKTREAILARRLEENLSKHEILTIYLNQIFLGNQSHGIEAAAQNYFRKNVGDLSVAEIALLAGLPKAPSRYSPFKNPKKARDRREYVLRRMLEEQIITQEELDEAEATEIIVYSAPNFMRNTTPYFTEEVRRELRNRFDKTTLHRAGLRVYTTVDVERYRAAEDAVYEKLRLVDKRQGFRGPLARYRTAEEREFFLEKYNRELKRLDRYETLEVGELYVALVQRVDKKKKLLRLRIGPHQAQLPLLGMRWAREVNPQVRYDAALLREVPGTFRRGDVLLVRATSKENLKERGYSAKRIRSIETEDEEYIVFLEQEPNLETALLSVHNKSGYVQAMIGGYSFDRSQFNRTSQACRQPGSSFKPIVYSAALKFLGWTLSQTILDAPLAFNDASAGNRWKPSNFGGQFQGEVSMRYALQNSMNVPAIRILSKVGVKQVIAWARQLGISTKLREELGLALGASCVKMTELSDVYRMFANSGEVIPRKLITRIEDRNGDVLFDNGWSGDPFASTILKVDRALTETGTITQTHLDPQTSFLMTKMMRNVVEHGTGTPAKAVGVPVAGKTGTTNDSFDAWFVGFTRELTTAVWVGFDDYVLPMGRYEQGGRAALPIWVNYVRAATKGITEKKTVDFAAPEGIVFVPIDGKSGVRVPAESPGAVEEAFKEGTEPAELAARDDETVVDDFFNEDF